MAIHDHSYKQFFSHPEMVREICQGFRALWLGERTGFFSTLERSTTAILRMICGSGLTMTVWLGCPSTTNGCMSTCSSSFSPPLTGLWQCACWPMSACCIRIWSSQSKLAPWQKLPPCCPSCCIMAKPFGRRPCSWVSCCHPYPSSYRIFSPHWNMYWLMSRATPRAGGTTGDLTAALIRAELAKCRDLLKIVANLLVWLDSDKQSGLRRAFKRIFFRRLLEETATLR